MINIYKLLQFQENPTCKYREVIRSLRIAGQVAFIESEFLFQPFEIRSNRWIFFSYYSERMFRKLHEAKNTNFNLYARVFPDQLVEDAKEFKNQKLQ